MHNNETNKQLIEILTTTGYAYYGHIQALCFDCTSQGKVVHQVQNGFKPDVVSQAAIDIAVAASREHAIEEKHSNVIVYVFNRGKGESTQTRKRV